MHFVMQKLRLNVLNSGIEQVASSRKGNSTMDKIIIVIIGRKFIL